MAREALFWGHAHVVGLRPTLRRCGYGCSLLPGPSSFNCSNCFSVPPAGGSAGGISASGEESPGPAGHQRRREGRSLGPPGVGGVGRGLGLFLLDDLVVAEVDLAVDVVGDDVVPVGEAGVELVDVLLAVGDLLIVFVLLPLVLLLDPLALGRWRRPSSGRRPSSSSAGFSSGFLSSAFFSSGVLVVGGFSSRRSSRPAGSWPREAVRARAWGSCRD